MGLNQREGSQRIFDRNSVFKSNNDDNGRRYGDQKDYTGGDKPAEFDVQQYIARMLLTHGYGMTDRNYCLLAGLIMAITAFSLILGIPKGEEVLTALFVTHIMLVATTALVVISIHYHQTIWLRLLMLISSIMCPLFSTIIVPMPYQTSFVFAYFVVMTALTGYSVREWLIYVILSLITWLIAALETLIVNWHKGFFGIDFTTATSSTVGYESSNYALSVSLNHNHDQVVCIMVTAFLEFLAMIFCTSSCVMFVKGEVFTSLYLLCVKPSVVLQLMQGSYTEQGEVLPTMITLHFLSEIRRNVKKNTLDKSYFSDAIRHIQNQKPYENNIAFLDQGSQSSYATSDFDDDNPDSSSESELIADTIEESRAFDYEVLTFLRNEISCPPSYTMGPFVNRVLQMNYERWIRSIYVPLTWHFYYPYTALFIFGCTIDAIKHFCLLTLIGVTLRQNYKDAGNITSGLIALKDLNTILVWVLGSLMYVTCGLIVTFITGIIIFMSIERGRVAKLHDHIEKFCIIYLVFSLGCSAVHQTILLMLRNQVVINEVAISYTRDSFFWVLWISAVPFTKATTHRQFLMAQGPLIFIRFILFDLFSMSFSNNLSMAIVMTILLMIPCLQNLVTYRKFIFSATISGRLVVSGMYTDNDAVR